MSQGLLLDLDAATLTVWVNGERKGVMVHPGMANDWRGQPVGRLEGPLRWAVDTDRSSVAIAGEQLSCSPTTSLACLPQHSRAASAFAASRLAPRI